ncbi:MAG: glycosyltransferase family 39 protein [Bacteroidales bacterium]|nr:glycosyltransferase family 39 protein [Bacteroidales bacterium]
MPLLNSLSLKIKNFRISANKLFLVVYLICFFSYSYNKILFYRPDSIHQWRNCICAAFALNYYHNANFLECKTNGLLADDRTSDVTLVEFPIVYYFVSILYRIFGPQEFLFRLVNILISYLGLFYLFKTGLLLLKDRIYALVLPLVVFTSTIYAFYTNNFIPDPTSLSVSFIGVYFFFKYYNDRIVKNWYIAMLFFLLAGLIKTPSLLFYFALGGIVVVELLFKKNKEKSIDLNWKVILSYLGVIVVLVGWYAFAKIYSADHGGSVSEVEIRPVWALSVDSVVEIWHRIIHRWFKGGAYRATWFLYLSFILFIGNIVLFKFYKRTFTLISILLFVGAAGFTVFFFRSMYQHDYYQTGNLIIIPVIFLSFLLMIKDHLPKVYHSAVSKSVLVLILVFLIFHCVKEMNYRYSNDDRQFFSSNQRVNSYGKITPYLRSLGIKRTDKVYSTPDGSINITLYLMDQKGFTDFFMEKVEFKDWLELFKEKGMQYVVLGDRSHLQHVENPDSLLGDKIGEFGNIEIYKQIKSSSEN